MRTQDFQDFTLVVCVNSYDHWWDDPEKIGSCFDNQKSINYLKSVSDIDLKIIDKSSKGNGWPEKKGGVGWARKVGMDYISGHANENDLIVCMDADTFYPDNYLSSLKESFEKDSTILGLAIPYYHRLTGEETDRLIPDCTRYKSMLFMIS